MSFLQKPKAPALPYAGNEFDRLYHDQFNKILRIYFNQLDAVNEGLLGNRGGKYLDFPYAAIQRTTDKSFTANTATQITFDTNDFLNGAANDGTDGIRVEQNGIYNYQFSVQLRNSDSQIHSAWIWLRINNIDVPGTGSKFDVTSSHGGTDGQNIAACNFFVSLDTNDTVEMWAAVSNTQVTFDSSPAQTTPFAMPAVPSVVATLSFVSQKD